MDWLIEVVVIAGFFLTPLVFRVTWTYKTYLRILVGTGLLWVGSVLGTCRWLIPSFYEFRPSYNPWRNGPLLVRVSISLEFFFTFFAIVVTPVLLALEYYLSRLDRSGENRRHLIVDAALVAVYFAAFIIGLHFW